MLGKRLLLTQSLRFIKGVVSRLLFIAIYLKSSKAHIYPSGEDIPLSTETRKSRKLLGNRSPKPLLQPVAEVYAAPRKPKDASPTDADALLEGLAAGWPKDRKPKLDESTCDALLALMPRLEPNGQLHLALLAGRWGMAGRFEKALAGLRKTLLATIADENKSEKQRIEAAQRLAQMQPDRAMLHSLLAEVSPKASPTLAAGILDAAGQVTSPELAPVLFEHWNQLTPRLRQIGVAILLSRPEWTRALLDALDKGTVSDTDLSLDQSQQLTNHPDKKLGDRARTILARGGQLPSPDRKKVLDEYMPLVEKTCDSHKGFEVFKNICAKCHRHGDTGETIAPNLTGFNVHPKSKILQ